MSTLGQRGCRLGGCYPSVWEGGLHPACSLSRADPGGEKLQPGLGGMAGLFPLGGRPIPGPVAATHKGASLPGSCRCTYCLHKKAALDRGRGRLPRWSLGPR